jgi:NAD(P)-dependent dehydrogenase (short-subunit alcohol dehydrogenase family)
MSNAGKSVLITGGAKGIGEGCARVFSHAGWRVSICDIDVRSGTTLAAELSAEGPGECGFVDADVSDPQQLKSAVDSALERYGRLDCLINNAGTHSPRGPVDECPVEEFNRLLQLNVVAVFLGCKFALPHLRKVRGSIINMSSLVSVVGEAFSATYCATKGAVSALTKALAIDEAQYGVRVNAVLPGNIVSDSRAKAEAAAGDPRALHDWLESVQWLGRSGTIEEAGRTCLFLASENASFITGVDLILSGGAELGFGPKVYDSKF